MRLLSLLATALLFGGAVSRPAVGASWDGLLASRPGPNYALTNDFGTTVPQWIPVEHLGSTNLSTRAVCTGPHVEMYSGGNCDGNTIRTLTLFNKKQRYDSKTNPSRGFSTLHIDGYPGSTGTNYMAFYRGGTGNYCSSMLFALVNWVGCVQFNDGFYYANGVSWDCW